jgi:hypothetical protein
VIDLRLSICVKRGVVNLELTGNHSLVPGFSTWKSGRSENNPECMDITSAVQSCSRESTAGVRVCRCHAVQIASRQVSLGSFLSRLMSWPPIDFDHLHVSGAEEPAQRLVFGCRLRILILRGCFTNIPDHRENVRRGHRVNQEPHDDVWLPAAHLNPEPPLRKSQLCLSLDAQERVRRGK